MGLVRIEFEDCIRFLDMRDDMRTLQCGNSQTCQWPTVDMYTLHPVEVHGSSRAKTMSWCSNFSYFFYLHHAPLVADNPIRIHPPTSTFSCPCCMLDLKNKKKHEFERETTHPKWSSHRIAAEASASSVEPRNRRIKGWNFQIKNQIKNVSDLIIVNDHWLCLNLAALGNCTRVGLIAIHRLLGDQSSALTSMGEVE